MTLFHWLLVCLTFLSLMKKRSSRSKRISQEFTIRGESVRSDLSFVLNGKEKKLFTDLMTKKL